MSDPFLGNGVAVFVDGELVLAAHGVDFRLLHLSDWVAGKEYVLAQFHILAYHLRDHRVVLIAQG